MKVCIGGTFDHLHKGHKTLINKACETAGEHGLVFIGITTNSLVAPKKNVKSFENRKETVEQYLCKEKKSQRYIIQPIYDKYGPTLTEDFDAIIISPETKQTAEQINKIRVRKGKKPLQIVQIPLILADDNKPISSSRIRRKEIDTDGRVFKRD